MAAEQHLSEIQAGLQESLQAHARQLSADLQAVEAPLADLNHKMQLTMGHLSLQVRFFADLQTFVDRLDHEILDENCGCCCLPLCNT